jgi:hypothetical protein
MSNVTTSTELAVDVAAVAHRLSLASVAPSIRTGPRLELEIPARVLPWHVGLWLALVTAGVAAALVDSQFGWLQSLSDVAAPVSRSSLVLLLLALSCEFMDATIGMGYGTTLTPILLVLGYPVGIVVPAALLSQLLANISAAFFHHQTGNFNFWNDHDVRNTGLMMGLVGLGVSVVTMRFALKLPDQYLRTGITLIVIGIGVFMLVGARFKICFRMRNVGILAAVAAFNKAFSGGGYGPLVCGGQLLVGLPVRAAVASTAVAEAMVCVAAVVTFYAGGRTVPLFLLLPLVTGSLLSTPLSAVTLNRLPQTLVKKLMALAILSLGAYALWQGKGI